MIVDKAKTEAARNRQRVGVQRVREAFGLAAIPAPGWYRTFYPGRPRVRPFQWRGRRH